MVPFNAMGIGGRRTDYTQTNRHRYAAPDGDWKGRALFYAAIAGERAWVDRFGFIWALRDFCEFVPVPFRGRQRTTNAHDSIDPISVLV